MLMFTLATLCAISAAAQGLNCKEVSFTLSGIAANKDITGIALNERLSAIVDFYNNARTVAATGTQSIKGTFRDASKRDHKNAKLQVLFHSITADHTAWSALGGVGGEYEAYKFDKYSWVRFANSQGYPTLAIDRLGNGKSAHPDAVLVVQAQYE